MICFEFLMILEKKSQKRRTGKSREHGALRRNEGHPRRGVVLLRREGVEYIKVQHLYRILIPLDHVLLPFCVRIGDFDRLSYFVPVQVFRVPCTLFVGIRVQRTNVDHCG